MYYKVKLLKIKDNQVVSVVEQNGEKEEIENLLKNYSNDFSPNKLNHGTYCEVLLSPTDRDEITLLWVRTVF